MSNVKMIHFTYIEFENEQNNEQFFVVLTECVCFSVCVCVYFCIVPFSDLRNKKSKLYIGSHSRFMTF